MMSNIDKAEKMLKEKLLSRDYQIGDKLPTERELLADLHVTRYALRQAMKRLRNEHYIVSRQGSGFYVGDPSQPSVKIRDQKTIGVLTTHLADYIFPKIISGIDQVVSDQDYAVVLSNTHNEVARERQSLMNFLDSNISGLIVEPTKSAMKSPNLDIYQELIRRRIPLVFMHAEYPELDQPVIKTADEDSEYELVNLLFKAHHRRILGVFQIDDRQGVDRMHGFVRAYQEHPELATDSNLLMYQSEESFEKICLKLKQFLASNNRPTAIAAYNDQLAIKLMSWLQGQGYRIPDDISIVGFDNYSMSEYVTPKLTTASHPKRKMGMNAAQMLLDQISHQSVASVVFPPQIIERESVRNLES
ncbi:GntR family transcriptional regulator [Lacticaseibacillus rhamnosus L34]